MFASPKGAEDKSSTFPSQLSQPAQDLQASLHQPDAQGNELPKLSECSPTMMIEVLPGKCKAEGEHSIRQLIKLIVH